MKIKKYKEKYDTKVLKRKVKEKQKLDYNWITKITLIAFFISFFLSIISEQVVSNINIFFSVLLLLVIICIGIIFDMIGIATTAADIKTFNSMASKKVRGSKTAINLIKNADKVSSFCNDVVGDICGIISGFLAVTISNQIASIYNLHFVFLSFIAAAVISAMTIGGKAMGKSMAVNKSNVILYEFSKVLSYFRKEERA